MPKRTLERMQLWLRLIGVQLLIRLGLIPHREIYFIGSSEVLPPPLTPEEEAHFLASLSAGDESVKSVLIEHNLRLVVYIARKFENTGVGIEDLVSIGTIGLIKAVNTFDPSKKIKLATYASRCIENEILMYLRKSLKTRQEVSLDEVLNVDSEGNEMVLADILGSIDEETIDVMTKEEEQKHLYDALFALSDREREIIEMRYGLFEREVMTQREVAELLGISQSYISRLEKRIIDKMRHIVTSQVKV